MSTDFLSSPIASKDPTLADLEYNDHPGSVRITVDPASGSKGNWAFAWENLRVTVEQDNEKAKVLLNNVSGRVGPGEIMAIMGPSGSGKSTFLTTICGRLQTDSRIKVEGNIHLGSKALRANVTSPGIMAYVGQDDKGIIGGLTVRENLQASADLRMPRSTTQEERVAHVNHVLHQLGLSKQADVIVGHVFKKGISGGQKRRVSLGIELVTGPSVLILDEITSGLDSTAAARVIELVKRLAKENNMRVLCTVHQPSAKLFAMFDSVLFLAGGSVAYQGPTSELAGWFASQGFTCPTFENPTDFVLDLLNTDFHHAQSASASAHNDFNRIVTGYQNTLGINLAHQLEEQKRSDGQPPAKQMVVNDGPSEARKAAVLTRRAMVTLLRDPAAFWIRLLMNSFVAFIGGTIWLNIDDKAEKVGDVFGGMYFLVVAVCFNALTAITTILMHRDLFIHEYKNGVYGTIPFVISQIVTIIPPLFLQAISVSIPLYWMMGLRASGQGFFYFVVVVFLGSLCAEGLVMNTSWLIPNAVAANACGVLVFGFLMMISGVFILPDNLPIYWRWSYHINLFKYTQQGMIWNEYRNRLIPCSNPSTFGCVDGYIDVEAIKSIYQMRVDSLFSPVWGLLVIYVVLAFLLLLLVAWISLRVRGQGKNRMSPATVREWMCKKLGA